jgi:hypothetical protein
MSILSKQAVYFATESLGIMRGKILDDIVWFRDNQAAARGEPGICHSYMASLATALSYLQEHVDPVQLMGSSAFAFRIWLAENFCPSAISVFDWSAILPEAVKQAGYECTYLCRYWDQNDVEAERRGQAHEAIVGAIDDGLPAVVWDVKDAEWGLIIGYEDERQCYRAMTNRGEETVLPYDRLGRNGIDILSVTIPGEARSRSPDEVIRCSLSAAVAHAEQKEWLERPEYQDGLPAYDRLSLALQRAAMLTESCKLDSIGADVPTMIAYNIGHLYSARCYARDYLASIAGDSSILQEAAAQYRQVAYNLAPLWTYFRNKSDWEAGSLRDLARQVAIAQQAERTGVDLLRRYLTAVHS